MIDLRSDTITKPSPEMRRAMAEAPVGDDVYGEDPTVNALQEKAAGMLGKEAALFVPTGTMANQIAAKVHTTPMSEIILDAGSHLFAYEVGVVAVISGVTLNLRKTARGILDPSDVASAIRPNNVHMPRTRLIWMENSHNVGGGSIYPLPVMRELAALAAGRGLALHMDGARIFNAAIAAGVPAREYADCCDSLNFCFSKGLGCPVGSIIVGTRAFIDEARRWRKALGGGMRQVGILAAAAAYALDHNIDRLAEDHEKARILGQALASHPMVKLDLSTVETNIVMPFFNERINAEELSKACAAEGVLFLPRGRNAARLVTHLDVSLADVRKAADIVRRALDKPAA